MLSFYNQIANIIFLKRKILPVLTVSILKINSIEFILSYTHTFFHSTLSYISQLSYTLLLYTLLSTLLHCTLSYTLLHSTLSYIPLLSYTLLHSLILYYSLHSLMQSMRLIKSGNICAAYSLLDHWSTRSSTQAGSPTGRR